MSKLEGTKQDIIRFQQEYDVMNAEKISSRVAAFKEYLNGFGITTHFMNDIEYAAFLNDEDVQVIYKDQKKIIWAAITDCSILDACNEMSLDTEIVCRYWHEAIEKSIQVVNPQFRFDRDYSNLRPKSKECIEWIILVEESESYEELRNEIMEIIKDQRK